MNEKAVEATSFILFVQMLEGGELVDELTNQLQEINAEMNNFRQDYGGKCKAKLTLDIDFILNKDGIFEIVAKSKSKTPDRPRGRTIAWSTPENHFTPQNPRQLNLPIRSVDDSPAEQRAVP